MSKNIEIARLLNVSVNTKTGQVFLKMEVTDPAWRQRILREWQDIDVKLVIEEKESKSFAPPTGEVAVAYDECVKISEAGIAAMKKIKMWETQ